MLLSTALLTMPGHTRVVAYAPIRRDAIRRAGAVEFAKPMTIGAIKAQAYTRTGELREPLRRVTVKPV